MNMPNLIVSASDKRKAVIKATFANYRQLLKNKLLIISMMMMVNAIVRR